MKTIFTLAIALLFFTNMYAQELPACVAELNKPAAKVDAPADKAGTRTAPKAGTKAGSKADSTKKPAGPPPMAKPERKYLSTVKLHDGHTVYAISLKRPPRCIDCASGVYYVDSLCKTVASFTIGFAPMASVNPGYTASDFPESNSPMFSNVLKRKQSMPACVSAAIAKPDSLKAAGVVRVQEVQLGGRKVYQFLKPVVRDKQCSDCATMISYLDSDCNDIGEFSVGGFAGIVAPQGFTKQDYIDKKLLRILWSVDPPPAGDLKPAATDGKSPATDGKPATVKGLVDPFPKPVSFTVTEVFDTLFKGMRVGDVLQISTAQGVKHLRKGKLINQYKIIPQKITQQLTNPCLTPPCPNRSEDRLVYYLEPAKRYFYINTTTDQPWLNFSKGIYKQSNIKVSFKEDEWLIGSKLKR